MVKRTMGWLRWRLAGADPEGGFSALQMIVLVAGLLILGLVGVVVATWEELLAWSRALRQNMNTGGAILPGLVVVARAWLSSSRWG
jgi:hypothetical protein